jgi:hypothetical protein
VHEGPPVDEGTAVYAGIAVHKGTARDPGTPVHEMTSSSFGSLLASHRRPAKPWVVRPAFPDPRHRDQRPFLELDTRDGLGW